MPRLSSDRALLEAFRAGRREALETVYLHYAPGVAMVLRHGFSVRSSSGGHRFPGLSQGADLQNGLQEVFARAFTEEARQGYDGLRPYAGYLAAIARNWVLNELRKEGKIGLVAELPDVDAPDPGPDRELEDRELEALVRRFHERLGDEARRLWTLRFERQLSQDEAAAALGKSRVQLRRLEARLKADLLAALQDAGYLEGRAPVLWSAVGKGRRG